MATYHANLLLQLQLILLKRVVPGSTTYYLIIEGRHMPSHWDSTESQLPWGSTLLLAYMSQNNPPTAHAQDAISVIIYFSNVNIMCKEQMYDLLLWSIKPFEHSRVCLGLDPCLPLQTFHLWSCKPSCTLLSYILEGTLSRTDPICFWSLYT